MAVVSRRRFLKLGAVGGVLLAAGSLLALHGGRYVVDERMRRRLRALTPKEFRILEAAADRILDGCSPAAREIEVALWLDGYVAGMDRRVRKQIGQLLRLLEHGTVLFGDGLRRFTDLSPAAQDACLRGWESSRYVVKRTGFLALKSLAMLAYYRDERTFAAIGYPGPVVPRGYDVHAVPR